MQALRKEHYLNELTKSRYLIEFNNDIRSIFEINKNEKLLKESFLSKLNKGLNHFEYRLDSKAYKIELPKIINNCGRISR